MRGRALIRYRLMLVVAVGLAESCSTDVSGTGGGPPSPVADGSTTSASATESLPEGTVSVQLDEFTIAVNPAMVPRGDVTFDVENVGDYSHEFKVVKLLPGTTRLPTEINGSVREDADGIMIVGEIPEKELRAGDASRLKVDFAPGHYILICNIVIEGGTVGPTESHYRMGMSAEFLVT
jgi:uncharacterized cupredoxin-like copper-binding protein